MATHTIATVLTATTTTTATTKTTTTISTKLLTAAFSLLVNPMTQ